MVHRSVHHNPFSAEEERMASTVLYMSISLDGFIAGPNESSGAGTFEPAGGWGGDHHDGVPIFIYSRNEPRIDISGWPLVTYVTDVETAMTGAKQAAGEKGGLGPRRRGRAARAGGRRPR
jgi:hypothetical protein